MGDGRLAGRDDSARAVIVHYHLFYILMCFCLSSSRVVVLRGLPKGLPFSTPTHSPSSVPLDYPPAGHSGQSAFGSSVFIFLFFPTTPPSPPTLRTPSPILPIRWKPLPLSRSHPFPLTLGLCYCSGHAQPLQRSSIASPALPHTHAPAPPFSEAYSRQAY